MNISEYITKFVKKNHRYKSYSKIYKNVLLGGKLYSLNVRKGYEESEYLPVNIKKCVMKYTSTKDTAIDLFKDFVQFLSDNGVEVPPVNFPPIPVSNTFERLLFIAKYLQNEDNKISELHKILWVSERQIEEDLSRLRGMVDPIQVCGKKFYIPESETSRKDGRIYFQSTAHPIFLAENLTQVMVMLKGLKEMAANPLYKPYAEASAREIWAQLSTYAKERLHFILGELLPEEYEWYEALSMEDDDHHFPSERDISKPRNSGADVLLDCMKNGKQFCIEYKDDDGVHLYKDCLMEERSYGNGGIVVNCSAGRVRIQFDKVIRSAYTVEELVAN